MHETEPCTRMFSNGMEFEWFIETWCGKCTRFRNGRCKVYAACQNARWDETKFPYKYLRDYVSGLGGKECVLFTTEKMKRKKHDKQINGQCSLFEEGVV